MLLRTISGKNYHFCFLRLNPDSPKMWRIILQYGIFSIFQLGFPVTWCLHSNSQSIVSYLSKSIWLENRWVCTPLWIFDGPELQESSFNLDKPRYSNLYFFNCNYFVFFRQGVTLDSFIPGTDCSFPNILKYDVYIGIGILISQKWQKCFLFRHISNFQLILLENYSFEFLFQVLNWRFHTTTWLLEWRISKFIPYIGLNFSIKISIDNFSLSNLGFF